MRRAENRIPWKKPLFRTCSRCECTKGDEAGKKMLRIHHVETYLVELEIHALLYSTNAFCYTPC